MIRPPVIADVDPLRARAAFRRWLIPDTNVLHIVVDGHIVFDRSGTPKNASRGALATLCAYNLLSLAQTDSERPADMDIIIRQKFPRLRCIVARETDRRGHGHGYAVTFITALVTIRSIHKSIRRALRDAWRIKHRRLVTPRPRTTA